MSDFSYLSQHYDSASVEEAIFDLEKELHDELALAETLGKDTADKVETASAFLDDNADIIADQHGRLIKLNEDLRKLVKDNKVQQQADREYDELVHSDRYLDAGDKLLDIKSIISGLRDFLVEEGVRGRAPVPTPSE